MATNYEINMFETDSVNSSKTMVTFKVTDTTNNKILVITKSVTTGSNTNAEICTAAQTAAQTEINAWVASNALIGKTWNPDTSEIK